MISKILHYLRCPACSTSELQIDFKELVCRKCSRRYPIRNGILDMMQDSANEVITPFQRLMQFPAIVSIYEHFWRQIGYFLASSRSFHQEIETILRIGKEGSAKFALDLASGTGIFTRPLARQEDRPVIGIDMSWPMLTHAQRLMQKEGIQNILYIRSTAFNLPFKDGAIPYVNCCGALHLFDRPDAALKEIARILSPGGYLSAQTTIRPNRSAGFAYVLERFIRFGFFDEDELREQIRLQGFTFIESERHRISFTFLAQQTSR
jgi:SAM-dependent methyltransferase